MCRHGMSAFAACCDCRCGRPAPWNPPDAGPHCDEHPASHPCHYLFALNATATRRCAYQENGPREGRGGISRPGAVGRDRGCGNCAQALLPERYILGGTNSQTPKLHSGFYTRALTNENLYQLVVHSLVPGSSAEQSRMIQVFPSSASASAHNKI